MTLETATLVLLLGFFVAAEVYVWRRGLAGVVVRFVDDVPPSRFVDRRLLVRLHDGSEIEASVSGCTACMARFVAGDPVRVVRHGRGHTVTIPWLEPRCSNASEGRCHA